MSMKAVGFSYILLSHRTLMTISLVIDRKKSVGINSTSPRAYLKNLSIGVISGDSLVLRGRPGPQGQLPKER